MIGQFQPRNRCAPLPGDTEQVEKGERVMVAYDRNSLNSLSKSRATRSAAANELSDHVDRYFREHPDVSREAFLLHALGRELADRERQEQPNRGATFNDPEENEQQSAEIAMRLAAMNYQRHGVWPRVRRFFSHSGEQW
jgi:hypothetical protein